MTPPHNQPNHLRSSSPLSFFSTEHHRHGCSKAQMCFFKILHIISVFPAADASDKQCFSHDEGNCERTGFDIDLNIGLRPAVEIERFEHPLTADAIDDGKNRQFPKNDRLKSESFVVEESELAFEEERAMEHSGISHVGDQSSGIIDYNGGSEELAEAEKQRDEGYLGLLIEAAQLIESEPVKKPPSQKTEPKSKHEATAGGTKRKQQCWTAAAEAEWYPEFEDASPVVKSKRGRNQVLPYKYRDSVVEPLVRWTSSRRRSSNSAAVPSKRRSK